MTLLTDFKDRFPGIAPSTADLYVPILESVWPCYYNGAYTTACDKEIILNLLAHLVIIESNAGSGSIKVQQSKSVGNVSVSFAPGEVPTSARNAWLSTTKYGSKYILLTSRRQGGVFV